MLTLLLLLAVPLEAVDVPVLDAVLEPVLDPVVELELELEPVPVVVADEVPEVAAAPTPVEMVVVSCADSLGRVATTVTASAAVD